MSVIRNKDGSITIKSNDSSISISGFIGHMSTTKNTNRIDNYAEQVTACPHSFKETEQYFLDHFEASPLSIDDERIKTFKNSLILNHLRDKLEHHPPEFSFDWSDEEMEKWHEEKCNMFNEVRNSSQERFGLIIRGYCLLRTEKNTTYYEEALDNIREDIRRAHQSKSVKNSPDMDYQFELEDICVFFEETTEHFQVSCDVPSVTKQLVLFRGVTEDDILSRSPRFMQYIYSLQR